MEFRIVLFLLVTLVSVNTTTGQVRDCLLNIGGRDNQTIIQVFQLNELQRDKLDNWSKELDSITTETEARIAQLFDTHPQKTDKDMVDLATKYAALKEEFVGVTSRYDQKLISLFNERQYERYILLCAEAGKQPIRRLNRLPED